MLFVALQVGQGVVAVHVDDVELRIAGAEVHLVEEGVLGFVVAVAE